MKKGTVNNNSFRDWKRNHSSGFNHLKHPPWSLQTTELSSFGGSQEIQHPNGTGEWKRQSLGRALFQSITWKISAADKEQPEDHVFLGSRNLSFTTTTLIPVSTTIHTSQKFTSGFQIPFSTKQISKIKERKPTGKSTTNKTVQL